MDNEVLKQYYITWWNFSHLVFHSFHQYIVPIYSLSPGSLWLLIHNIMLTLITFNTSSRFHFEILSWASPCIQFLKRQFLDEQQFKISLFCSRGSNAALWLIKYLSIVTSGSVKGMFWKHVQSQLQFVNKNVSQRNCDGYTRDLVFVTWFTLGNVMCMHNKVIVKVLLSGET